MPDDIYRDEESSEVYEDFEEYVDLDEHERARAYERRQRAEETRERLRHEDYYDEYYYGEDSGEAGVETDE